MEGLKRTIILYVVHNLVGAPIETIIPAEIGVQNEVVVIVRNEVLNLSVLSVNAYSGALYLFSGILFS